mgnify:CR=1 FL=1
MSALRLSPDSTAGKNAAAMSIASQQVSCARVFDRFTNVIWVKTTIISGTSVRRKKNRCNDCGSESPIPTTVFTGLSRGRARRRPWSRCRARPRCNRTNHLKLSHHPVVLMLNYVTVEHVHASVIGELKLELECFAGIEYQVSFIVS